MSRTANLKVGSPAQLLLERADGSSYAIHPLWLRERCKDAASMDLKTQQRLQDPSDFDLELKIVALSQPAAGTFRVKFSDGHEASFSAADILEEACARSQQSRLPGSAAVGRLPAGPATRALAGGSERGGATGVA